jgi:hypothetical protein
MPVSATACNCTLCRRFGALWAYGFRDEAIRISGRTSVYVRGEDIGFHFCPECGAAAYWLSLEPGEDGRHWMAVNLRLAEDPALIGATPIRHFEGLESFREKPMDGRCVRDYWY